MGVLEEIDAFGATLAVERDYSPGIILRIQADGFDAPAVVTRLRPRNGESELVVEFLQGFRWNPVQWRPNHLTAVSGHHAKTKAAGGE